MTKLEQLHAEIRATPLPERLKRCQDIIGKMCSEGRPPRMSIPPQATDEDFLITVTLEDAWDALYKIANE